MSKTSLEYKNSVAYVTLNNPSKHNAFDDVIIGELRELINTVANNDGLRAFVLQAEGKNFCAGADLHWMKRMAQHTHEENYDDAKNLAALMQDLYTLPIPSIARVQGAAFGGALGLIACSDIVIAESAAKFCLSETMLGLAPATIGPYVVEAIGARQAKRLFLSAELFSAEQALSFGLVHQVVESAELEIATQSYVSKILKTGPSASRAAKQLVTMIKNQPENLNEMTSKLIADLRVSPEGQAGLKAFFAKEHPPWNA